MKAAAKKLPKGEKVLCLRTSGPGGKAYAPEARGFQWPAKGFVEAPDWKPAKVCGYGLHGLLYGEGDSSHLKNAADTVWQVVEVLKSEIVDLTGKVKFPRCVVLYSGSRDEAVKRIQEANPQAACAYGTSTSGDSGTSTSGYGGTSTSGDSGTSTSGDSGTSTSGDSGTSTSGYGGTSTSGDSGTSTSGYGGTSTSGVRGTSTSGDSGTSTSGYGGTSTSGYGGTSTSGDSGTSTSGYGGTSTSGYGGTSTSGEGGVLAIEYYDNVKCRYRKVIGHIGEDGLKPNTKYKLSDAHTFVEVVP